MNIETNLKTTYNWDPNSDLKADCTEIFTSAKFILNVQ